MNKSVLLDYQQQWLADKSPLKVCEKGRRTGITWAEALDDVIIAASAKSAGGMNVYYFPQAKEDAVEYIESCAKWAKAFDHVCSDMIEGDWETELGQVLPADDPDKFIKTYKVEFASGFRIVALSSSPSRARGKQGVFVIDEAAFHPNLKGVLKAVMASFLRGGRIRVISTHDGELNPFNELINEIRSGKRRGTVHRYPFQLAVEQGMYKRICEVDGKEWTAHKEQDYIDEAYGLYGDDAAEELDAVPSLGEGTYLSRALIEAIMCPDTGVLRVVRDDEFTYLPERVRQADINDWCGEHLLPLIKKLDTHLKCWFGSDFARSGDASSIWPVQQQQNLHLHTPFIIEMRNIPHDQQKQILFYMIDRLPRFMTGAMDARGNGEYMAEAAAQCYGTTRIEQVKLSQQWYLENMPRVKSHFEDQTVDLPQDNDVLTDFRMIKKDKGVAKIPDDARAKGSDGRSRHGDHAVAFALAAYAVACMDTAPIEYESVNNKSRWDDSRRDEWHNRPYHDDDYIDHSFGGGAL